MVLPSAPSKTDISCLVSWAVGEDGGLLILREGDGTGPPILGLGAGCVCVCVCGGQSWAPHPPRQGGGWGDGAADTHMTQLLGMLGRVGNGLSLTQEQGWMVKKMRGFK